MYPKISNPSVCRKLLSQINVQDCTRFAEVKLREIVTQMENFLLKDSGIPFEKAPTIRKCLFLVDWEYPQKSFLVP